MQFSTKVRYGLYAMVELACRHDGQPVQLGSIAEHQDVSPKYLHAVMQQLKLAGLVRTVRGAKGGFVLARSPERIGALEVIEALDGPVGVTDCSKHQDCECENSSRCVTRRLWCQISEAIRQVLEGHTLADLADQVHSAEGGLLVSPEE
jgi:Rrf2 family protein